MTNLNWPFIIKVFISSEWWLLLFHNLITTNNTYEDINFFVINKSKYVI
jgi:hypothetical protein